MDVFIEASSSIIAGAQFCLTALEHHKHLVMMNAEIDLIFGPYLAQQAHWQEVVYTSCDGDQHGVIKRLVDDLQLWGFNLVMAGNMKGFLDRYSNPTKIIPEADKRNLDYKMATAYTDGTKLCVEMALTANALGLHAERPGMAGPRVRHVKEVFEHFDFATLYAQNGGVVDYVLGAQPDGGVFAIGYCDHPYQQSMLKYYKMGSGPFYLFYRPYHLCHVEAMECVVEAALDHVSLLEPVYGLRTNVYAYAKKPLPAGEALDGIGGYCCYGLIENAIRQRPRRGCPSVSPKMWSSSATSARTNDSRWTTSFSTPTVSISHSMPRLWQRPCWQDETRNRCRLSAERGERPSARPAPQTDRALHSRPVYHLRDGPASRPCAAPAATCPPSCRDLLHARQPIL